MDAFTWTIQALQLYGHSRPLIPPCPELPARTHKQAEPTRKEMSDATRQKMSEAGTRNSKLNATKFYIGDRA